MPAVLAWLDHSEAEQQRAREIIRFFSQRETRDELGIGGIRDSLSDTLFPGTSTLLTRARYVLFIPWLYREGARRGNVGPTLNDWVLRHERRLIEALRSGGDLDGLIGVDAGPAIKTLPSTIYWNTLRQFEILRRDVTKSQVAGLPRIARSLEDATEFLGQSNSVWAPTIPQPPADFFKMDRCDFALTHDEATWLAERIDNAVPGTLLQFLVARPKHIAPEAASPWEDPDAAAATGRIRDALDEARRFSLAMHGAALLYNALLAERAEQLGLNQYAGLRDEYAEWLEEWRREVEDSDVGGWDLNRLWRLVAEQGRPVKAPTREFVTEWVDLATTLTGREIVDDAAARALVRNREHFQKRGQARLRNDRLMQQWGGASGSGRIAFRWAVVRRLLNDIADGRENGRAGA